MGHINKMKQRKGGCKKSSPKSSKKKYLNASSVIEMSYIMPLFLFLFVIIIHTVFYYHDKAVIYGAAGETAAVGAQEERKKGSSYDLESFFRERVNGKLIYLRDTDVSVVKTSEEITVSVSAQRGLLKVDACQKARIVRPEQKIRRIRWIM